MFKMKAYQKSTCIMHNNFQYLTDDTTESIIFKSNKTRVISEPCPRTDFIIMLGSSEYDINSKEIFTDDIVLCHWINSLGKKIERKGVVIFDGLSFQIDLKYEVNNTTVPFNCLTYIEILGNINFGKKCNGFGYV